MESIEQINIKNCIYYFFRHMIRIKDLNLDLLKIDKTSYKNNNIHYIRYITIKNK